MQVAEQLVQRPARLHRAGIAEAVEPAVAIIVALYVAEHVQKCAIMAVQMNVQVVRLAAGTIAN